MTIKSVGVLGAGTMGRGIAQVFAQRGFQVQLVDNQPSHLQQALLKIQQGIDRDIEKGRVNATERDQALHSIHTSPHLDRFVDCDLVIEAVSEEEPTKIALFQSIDRICPDSTILASNTSAISLTRMAAATNRPDRFMGMHFMNPVVQMDLVELIRALQTSDATHQALHDLTQRIQKTPVTVKDYPGFVSNRILMPMINEAIYTLYEGVASSEDIDAVMTLGMNHPMGPLALADVIGLDTCLVIMNVLHDGFKDSKYRPCPLLQQMVDAGNFGKKSGRGFYPY
ncbi:3-hydroxybutyryl-CoA dehydrogenase [Reinekea sp.]|uniref:3-hydroxybutyryl-CoA dehydrogenase n=1 Tax=Reinekea sp. TaxID=1970455 RepID=UPI002A81CB83|nr:3-hydroxybutyryl-CoA dehydrogenase [Reinekea sp.]